MIKILLLMFISLPVYATDLSVNHIVYNASQFASGQSIDARVGNKWYIHGSYERTHFSYLTQRLGRTELYSGSIGYKDNIGNYKVYIQGGYYHPAQSTRNRTLGEIVYYRFLPTFGVPPFEPPNGFHGLDYEYDIKPNLGFTVGVIVPLRYGFNLDVSYRALSMKESFAMQSPGSVFIPETPDSCGCRWEGQNNIKFNAWKLGLSYAL